MRTRRFLALAGAIMCAGLVSSPADAAGAQHLTIPEVFDGAEHFAAGEQACVSWAGTFHEVRNGAYDIVVPPGGRVSGEAHVNGAVDGFVELVPDDPALPTYTGHYREKVNGVLVGTDTDGNDVLRVAHYALSSTLSGSDGSSLRLRLSGHIAVDARGRVVVARDELSCG